MCPSSCTIYSPAEDSMDTRTSDLHLRRLRRSPPPPRDSTPRRYSIDRRPIHRLRKPTALRHVQEISEHLSQTRPDHENAVFKEGFQACASLLQTYVRTHRRMSNHVKDDFLITIHYYLQYVNKYARNVDRHAQDVITGAPLRPVNASTKLKRNMAEKIQIKQENPENCYVRDHVTMRDDGSMASEMMTTYSDDVTTVELDVDSQVGSPLFLNHPNALSRLEAGNSESISCRHCNEEGVISVDDACCVKYDNSFSRDTLDYYKIRSAGYQSPEIQPQDLSVRKSADSCVVQSSATCDATTDMWRPWGSSVSV